MMNITNKYHLLKAQAIISLISLLFILTVSTLQSFLNGTHNNNLYFLHIYIPVVCFICTLCILYLVNFIIAFFINTNKHKLLISIKISSWIFILSSFNWLFIFAYIHLYKKKNDDYIKSECILIYKLKKYLLLVVFFSSILSIVLFLIGIFGQLNWFIKPYNNPNYWFLPFAFFSLQSWSITFISLVSFIILYKWDNKTIIWNLIFLLSIPFISSIVLLNFNKMEQVNFKSN